MVPGSFSIFSHIYYISTYRERIVTVKQKFSGKISVLGSPKVEQFFFTTFLSVCMQRWEEKYYIDFHQSRNLNLKLRFCQTGFEKDEFLNTVQYYMGFITKDKTSGIQKKIHKTYIN